MEKRIAFCIKTIFLFSKNPYASMGLYLGTKVFMMIQPAM